MKALTIWQPWASLIMTTKPQLKLFEFRGWPAPLAVHGQRIVIHAGSRPVKPKEVAGLIEGLLSGKFCGDLEPAAIPLLEDVLAGRRKLPLAAGLGTAKLGTCKQSYELWPEEFAGYSDSDREACSNWAWPLSDVEPFAPVVPCLGRQGLWNWPWSGAAQ